jgi:cyclohexanecarboxylate-CoA ligase
MRPSDETIRRMTAAGLWPDETAVTYLDRWATRRPAKLAMTDGTTRYTYEALARAVDRIAHGLAAHGVGRGSIVSLQLPNWNEWVLMALATARAGAIVHTVPPTFRAHELRFMLNLLESHVLVVPETFRGFSHAAMVAGLRAEVPKLAHVFVARGTPGDGMRAFAELTDQAWESRAGRGPLVPVDPNDLNEIIFTSGTTGEPKGVMHTSNTAMALFGSMIEELGFSDRDVLLMPSTFGHQTAYLYGLLLFLALGATGVWLDIWNAETAARFIEAERVTFTMGATPFLHDLTYTSALARHDCSSLRLFISAGAPIPRQLVRDARERLGCAISAGWGMTENGLVTRNGLDDPPEKVFGTDGKVPPGMELRVVGPDARVLPPDTEGDLQVRGSAQFIGYFKRPEFTTEAYTADGWFKTGDLGRLDRDAYLSITGRAKDLIIRGGENISVAEVENLLFTHPKVQSVAIVAMPDERLQERACAFVVPTPGQSPTLAELTAFLEGKVAKVKWPERVELVSEFPMTPSGKIQKFRLREAIAEKLAAEGRSPGPGRGPAR